MPRVGSRKRKRLSIGRQATIRDVWGEPWMVSERRPTQYRFAIYMGWPVSPTAGHKSGKAAVIVTPQLAAHMRAHAQRPYAYPLPIGDNARRRIRELLNVGHRQWIDSRFEWWLNRIDDLGALSSAKFVAKHGKAGWTRTGTMSTTLVWQMRTRLLGMQRHPVGWWKAPEVKKLVTSKLSLDEIAERLDVAPVTVYGLRYRIKKMARGTIRNR